MNEIVLIACILLLFATSTAGIFLPFLPGVFFSWLAVLIYAYSGDFVLVSLTTVLWLLGLFILTVAVDMIAPILGARKNKASTAGIVGSILGFISGFMILGPLGVIVGPIVGALIGELANGRSHRESLQVALGSFLGFLVGTLFKVVAILIMFGVFLSAAYYQYRPIGGDVEKARLDYYIASKSDLIRVESPKIFEKIKSPLRITGHARGYWFFEASFPIVLADLDGNVIAQSFATAQSEWMTTEFVPFEATFEFTNPQSLGSAHLILKKDNPSGLPEHDDQIEIPVLFE